MCVTTIVFNAKRNALGLSQFFSALFMLFKSHGNVAAANIAIAGIILKPTPKIKSVKTLVKPNFNNSIACCFPSLTTKLRSAQLSKTHSIR